jgi:hypothetical protein
VYVDGEKINGKLYWGGYVSYLNPPCEPDDDNSITPNYIGKPGDHIFELKDTVGAVYETGVFTLKKNECTSVRISPSGCIDRSGGGGGGGGGLPSNYQNQGTITVRSYSLNICMRDFATIDGDKIDLVINGTTVLSNKEVTGTNQCYNLTLQSPTGNWIGVIARSEGSIPPCTPGISVNDGFTTQDFEIRSYVGGINGAYIINVN